MFGKCWSVVIWHFMHVERIGLGEKKLRECDNVAFGDFENAVECETVTRSQYRLKLLVKEIKVGYTVNTFKGCFPVIRR